MRVPAKLAIATGALVGACGASVLALNYTKLQRPLDQLVSADSRNAGIEVDVHYKGYVPGGVLVYDLRSPGPRTSAADVFRVFLQFADAMKDDSFDSVELAFRGETKFVLSGSHFRMLGREYRTENPVYTVRTFPEKLLTPDGKRAFEEWSGGWIGVLGAQMDDFNAFTDQWYAREL